MTHLPSKNGQEGCDRFRSYDASIETLRSTVPTIHQALRPHTSVAKVEGWQAMVQRHDAFRKQGSKPILVATLYGPTGAGKSTLFRLLTGVPVPAGDDVRPVSYACIIAIPDSLAQASCVERVFPGFQLERLSDVKQLRIDQGSETPVFWVPYSPIGKAECLPLALVDVPDFNSMHEANWAKAEQMMSRAEIVLFIVYRESYADDRVVRELARCCRLAARMAFVLTKTDKPEQAGRIWSDLVRKLGEGDTSHARTFRELRADGQTLHAFLSRCPVYYSPRTESSRLPAVQILSPENPPLDSLLRGLDAENILLDGLLQPTRPVMQACRRMSEEVAKRIADLQQHLDQVHGDVQRTAAVIAGTEFPVGRWMELVIEEARRHQSRLIRVLATPGYWLSSGMRQIIKGGKRFIGLLRGQEGEEIRKRHELERNRLQEAADHLVDRWRSRFPHEAYEEGLLAQDRCGKVRDSCNEENPPEPATDWEQYVRKEVSLWAAEHPWLCTQMSVLPGILAITGVGLLVADLALTGGTFGAILASKMVTVTIGSQAFGVLAAAGAGSTAAGLLLGWANKWKLNRVLQKADDHWREQRSCELGRHLAKHLSSPLFGPWQEQLAQLRKAPVAECLKACNTLDQLGLRQSPEPFHFRCGGLAHNLTELVSLCRRHPDAAAWHLSEGHFEPWLQNAGLAPLADRVRQIRTSGPKNASPLDAFVEEVHAVTLLTKESPR